MLIGLGYKAALVPFQFWPPDAYDGAPVSVAAYLSVITKVAAIFAFAQILRDLPVGTSWPMVVARLLHCQSIISTLLYPNSGWLTARTKQI